ncbi:Zinc finger SWIM-type [Arabidopsis thaliana x Arabidopsis arenosa]|uniref:Zinc finger SWIM-type n=1 Tax=Arabidopsis thaliana x Arabidopsis arenosa TaxID=1240361 RepID=A0A8T2FMA1_9BRAS|nr:Zinc finger SWIM-type [Arabidopsis thaliana x Arabidopsis arenosa]
MVKSVSAPTTETNGEAVDGAWEWLDEAVLRELEALERVEAEKARVKGKGKMPFTVVEFLDSEEGAFQYDSLDGYTSGGREEVVATPEPEPQVADYVVTPDETVGQDGGVGEDISAAVLAYRSLPMQLENIYDDDDEIGTCPTTDAEPCFVDELNLTTTEVCAVVRVYGHIVANGSKNFEVQTTTLTHKCSVTSRAQYGKQATAKVIVQVLRGKYSNGAAGPHAMDVPDIVLLKRTSTNMLAVYMHLLEQGNRGTVYKLHHTQKSSGVQQFKYLFFALGASIVVIKHMRKVILVDGTAIKARFKGVHLAASMQDANFQVYPIAFGIVYAENELAWTWFFQQLSQIVPVAEDLVLVTNRHRSIYAVVGQFYPKAFHGACAVHLERNVKVRWARHVFAETLNDALAKIFELPLVTMVDGIRGKVMRWFCLRRVKAAKMTDPITPNANKMILEHNVDSVGLVVIQVSQWSYQVVVSDELSYYVDLEKKTCTCLQFQKLLISCCHALVAARINNVHIPTLVGNEYSSELFGKQYEALIFPVPN